MSDTTGYRVTLYDAADKPVDDPFPLSSLPYPGLVILYAGEAWEVRRVSVTPAHPLSPSASRGNFAALVDVRVTRSEGIHEP